MGEINHGPLWERGVVDWVDYATSGQYEPGIKTLHCITD